MYIGRYFFSEHLGIYIHIYTYIYIYIYVCNWIEGVGKVRTGVRERIE